MRADAESLGLDRVDTLTENLLATLTRMPLLGQACILLLTQRIWGSCSFDVRDICLRPLLYREPDLITVFHAFQATCADIRNRIDSVTARLSDVVGIDRDRSRPLVRHAELVCLAYEVWMVTLCIGVQLDHQRGVQDLWDLLRRAESVAPEARAYLGKLLQLVEDLNGLVSQPPPLQAPEIPPSGAIKTVYPIV